MPDRPWTRDEVLLTIDLYCKLPYRKLRQTTPEIRELAHLLGRTPSAISKRCCNYVQFDPVESKRVKGFSRAAKLDRAIWAEINQDWERFAIECEQIRADLIINQRQVAHREINMNFSENILLPIGRNRSRISHVRTGQQFFRAAVLTAYNYQCCITGLKQNAFLIASHIKPWKDSDPKTERTNPRNGLCLSPLYDKAFDSGLMTIDEKHRIIFSPAIWHQSPSEVEQLFFHRYEGKTLLLPERFRPEPQFLEYHRMNIFKTK